MTMEEGNYIMKDKWLKIVLQYQEKLFLTAGEFLTVTVQVWEYFFGVFLYPLILTCLNHFRKPK